MAYYVNSAWPLHLSRYLCPGLLQKADFVIIAIRSLQQEGSTSACRFRIGLLSERRRAGHIGEVIWKLLSESEIVVVERCQ